MRYFFNKFTVDTDRFELSLEGKYQVIEPQALSLLILLIENRHRMLGKEEIYNSIWAGRVVSESALSSRIKMIRQALGDNGRSQHSLRTLHGKGFRFVASVVAEPAAGTQANPPALEDALGQQQSQQHAPQISQTNTTSKPAIVVLPFVNLSSNAEQAYFSDGITADITAFLSKHRWLNVVARNTAFCYKGKDVDIRALGKELEVKYVVEGSVQRSGDRMRINTNLIDATTGHQLWGEQYHRNITDIFALQDEITTTLVARLEPEIGFSERDKVMQNRPTNLQAWDCFHMGVYHFFKFTDNDNLEAQRLLLQSRELDPHFGEAFSWWAYAVILGMVYWSTQPSDALIEEALAACNTALSFDRQNATFYALKARALLAHKDYDQAIIENKKAIALNPSFAAAHCGLGDSLAYEGRYEEAIVCFQKAIDLSPNDPQLWAFYSYGALALIFKGDYTAAVKWADAATHIPNCQYWALAHKMVAQAYLKQSQQCADTKHTLLSICPEFSASFAKQKLFYLRRNDQIQCYMQGLTLSGIYFSD